MTEEEERILNEVIKSIDERFDRINESFDRMEKSIDKINDSFDECILSLREVRGRVSEMGRYLENKIDQMPTGLPRYIESIPHPKSRARQVIKSSVAGSTTIPMSAYD